MPANELKILWITERYPPLEGGMATSASRQVTGLRKRGIETHVLLFHRTKQGVLRIDRHDRDMGIDIIVSNSDAYGNSAQRAWREILEKNNPSPYRLVFGFGAGFPGYVAVTYAAWLDVPSMVSVRGNDFDSNWFEPKKAPYVRETLARANSIAAVSIEKVDKIMALYPGKDIFWSPNGINHELWELLPNEKKECLDIRNRLNGNGRRVIGFFGELKYKKRIPAFVSAIYEAGLTDKTSFLVTGKMNPETSMILSDPILAPLYEHISFRPPEKLPPLYAACDFIAIPSLFEGFPNVLLESMAAGAIPIVSNAGAMKDIVTHGETGFLFTPANRNETRKAVTEALTLSDEKLGIMKNSVRNHIKQKFSIENELDVLEKHIRNTLCTSPKY